MDYGKIISRAWEITWRWKALWILGLLAGLGTGMGSGSNFSSANRQEISRWMGPSTQAGWQALWAVVAAVACLALLVGIALWVISVMARGGLIAGVQQVEEEGSTTFVQAWRVGRSRFWTLFGIGVLAILPAIVLAIVAAVGVALYFIPTARTGALANTETAAVWGILCGGAFCCGMVFLVIVLEQVRTYAERAAILEGLGWIDAFRRGWTVLKENLGPTIVFWLIFVVIGLLLAAVIGGGLALIIVPFFAIFRNVQPGTWLLVPICFGGLLGIIVGAVISSIVTTFTSATWTLVYRRLTGHAVPAETEPAPVQ